MFTFLKAQASSLTATFIDFSVTVLSKEIFGIWYVVANICGNISGGIANFFINRSWVFEGSTGKKMKNQMIRYILVWGSSAVLNTLGLWLLTRFGSLNYILSKIIISLLVGWGFNYILQKKYVFK
ncbi:MAG: GtrA family protein [Ginsengibacter sp.]